MQRTRARRVRRGDGKQRGMVTSLDNEEEDSPPDWEVQDERDRHIVATVLANMPSAEEVTDMLGHTDPTGTAGDHETQVGIIPGSQGEKETEVQDEATTRGAELLLTAARVRDLGGSMSQRSVAFNVRDLGGSTSQSSPVFNTTVPFRPHARDTPRAESDLLKPPAVGTKWHWQPAMCNADGANAGPNGIRNVCLVTDPSYTHVRGHCSVHVKRDIHQQKHAVFEGSSEEVKEMANTVTAMIEMVKNHSTTVACADLGKQMIHDYLHDLGQLKAADYLARHHLRNKWTLVEMNDNTPAGGGVPCQSNAIERRNLDQKCRKEFKRSDTLTFLEYSAEDLEQQSMDDLTFGRLMPKGYITAKNKIDKTVWTARFFAQVKSEVDNYVGLHKLTWSVKFGTYARGTLIMCSRKMRAWLLDDKNFAEYYSRQTSEKNKLKVMRNAITDTTSAGESYMSQFQNLIKNPASYAGKQKWKFKDIIEWQKSFHILEPITDEKYVQSLLQRLRNSGLPLNETVCAEQFTKVSPCAGVAEVSTEAPKRFHKCSCGRYRHYLWCLHVMLRATHDNLVQSPYCPPNLDTTKVKNLKDRSKEKGEKGEGGKSKRKEREGGSCLDGRPAKAKKGGGLSRDQG